MSKLKNLEYKTYSAIIFYCEADKVYFGKIRGIDDLVSFESPNLEGLQEAFIEAVDDYENDLKLLGKK